MFGDLNVLVSKIEMILFVLFAFFVFTGIGQDIYKEYLSRKNLKTRLENSRKYREQKA